MKLPGLLALASLLAYPVAAQTPLKEVIDVRVTNVEVMATDSKGNHVPGLTRDDFELYENGKLQTITNFFEASAPASSGAARKTSSPRRIVIGTDGSITFSMKIFLEKGQDLISFGVLDHRSQATGFSKLVM